MESGRPAIEVIRKKYVEFTRLGQFYKKYHGWDGVDHRWFTAENPP